MTKTFHLPSGWVRSRLYYLLAPLVALAAVAIFEQTWLGDFLEDQTINLRFRARAPFDPPADPRLVLVGIDQQSLDKFGRYPWPRSVIAKFLTDLAQTDVKPHTVTFDIFYTDQSADPGADQALGDAAGLLPSVITAALGIDPSGEPTSIKTAEENTARVLQDPGPTAPYTNIHGDANKIRETKIAIVPVDALRKQSFFGFANDEPSRVDDVRHVIPLIIRVEGKVYPSLALQTLCQMLNVDADKVEVNVGQSVVLKNSSGKSWTIPVNDRGEYTINYRRSSSFNNLSFGLFATAMENYAQGVPLPAACQIGNKTLLVGETEVGLTDLGPTPIDSRSPLPYTHLNVLNNVLQNDYVRFVPWYTVAMGWVLVTWISLLRLKNAPLVEAIFTPIALVALYTAFAFAIFGLWSLQIALSWPVLGYGVVTFGAVVLRWREEQRGREHLKQLFSRMLSPEVMNHLLEHPQNLKLGGSERAVTILFSDIRDYTKFSEGLTPAEVVRQLNLYFERMVDCVKENQGTLHKYIGDAIMAAWGDIAVASLGPEKDAQNAVRAALMMRRHLRLLNEERQAAGLSSLRIGVGVNHDEVLVGLIGASSRSEFTVMGDGVNTASRLEGITKEFRTDLAISESVRRLVGDAFLVRRLGFIQLKGKTKPTMVYEVLADKTEPGESRLTPETIARYEEALDHFLARRFTEAEAGFLACQPSAPGDYSIENYRRAAHNFAAQPPPPDWDGRIVMETK